MGENKFQSKRAKLSNLELAKLEVRGPRPSDAIPYALVAIAESLAAQAKPTPPEPDFGPEVNAFKRAYCQTCFHRRSEHELDGEAVPCRFVDHHFGWPRSCGCETQT